MRMGIIGSGNVGQALGIGFAQAGHEVKIGTREPGKLSEWVKKAGFRASAGSNREAAQFGELIVICTQWDGTENAINLAGKENFTGKIVIDTTNPLKFIASDKPPVPSVSFPHSCGKIIQEWLPQAKVVKCFNIVPAPHMVNPSFKEGKPDMFIAGNDANAKQTVSEILEKWGWFVNDVGGIEHTYLLEGLAMLLIHEGITKNQWNVAWKLLRK